MPATLVVHDEDPADKICELAGNIDDIEIFNNKVLVAIYQRASESKTTGGIILTHKTTDEDKYQSKVGLLIKMGPRAFVDLNDPPKWFVDQDDMAEGDWVFFRPSDGMSMTFASKDSDGKQQLLLCRLLDDTSIMGRINSELGPDRVY